MKSYLMLFLIILCFPFAAASDELSPEQSVQEITAKLSELSPITWPATPEKYHLVIFIDNQCSYCTDVVKRVQQYTDAGLTMSFLTVAPPAIKQQVIGDMARVWCSVSPRESLRKAMTGFLPDNDATPECVRRVMAQSALAERVGIQVSPVMVVVQDKPVVFLGNASPSEILKALEQ
ncbi:MULTISPECIES: thioredoxin fold domain-containing protein [Enterobacterales]|jgi:thiol:disulfide interchange protein DsbC|uniref:Thioredoxin-like fold domain-containing protein n=1 Tax=Rahnella sp. (strain Y9602) TaxID=2703885 RepID=A0A0H3FKA5_RAHSY|nr:MULTISPECIES: thioredoxin fold domain-containing protein [Enterobacterales]MDP9707533.1 thiol:disulfide interchange protein DsbC [Rahnella aquatilis]ADW76736.1 hypothetical protein Rahaq_5175 [Rahnella aceris]MCI4201344.1 thioredoxin fold domain-containing protein [Dickeya dianthicola]MCI4209998.1 thioredoxin fold domain-containing protein [Dickeya dianthicola]MZG45470.1 thioredoxin fold domain-containing protein [Dickeya dianthicola]